MRNSTMARISLSLLMMFIIGCHSASQSTFKTPDAAVDSLVAALRTNDTAQLEAIFGPTSADMVSSGDDVADRNQREKFIEAYDVKHDLTETPTGEMQLVIGEKDWPFPIPLVRDKKGWTFDTAAGKDEILNRRIGRNELYTIQVCLATVDAQREYARLDPMKTGLPVYARRFISQPGTKDGLYWPTAIGDPPSPLGELVADAAEEGYTTTRTATGEPAPFHGYHYRLLTKQGPAAPGGAMDYEVEGKLLAGFAVVAIPAEYGNSGIMTFIASNEGVVYQRDLGPDTVNLAKAMSSFNPEPGWSKLRFDH